MNDLDDAIHMHWISKNSQEFWKVFHAKLAKKLDSRVSLPECISNVGITNKFFNYFNSIYHELDSQNSADNQLTFDRSVYKALQIVCSYIIVQQIDSCLRELYL
jgi:hypothetical protein